MNNKEQETIKEEEQDKLVSKEDTEFFADLYEEMTDPVRIEERIIKEKAQERIEENKEDYGIYE